MLQAKTASITATNVRSSTKADKQNTKTEKTLAEIILAEREHIHHGGRRYFADNTQDMRDYFGKD